MTPVSRLLLPLGVAALLAAAPAAMAQQGPGLADADTDALFAAIDTDGDGMISPAEWAAWREIRRATVEEWRQGREMFRADAQERRGAMMDQRRAERMAEMRAKRGEGAPQRPWRRGAPAE